MPQNNYQMADGTPKRTGRTLVESVATVRIDDTQAPNGRVAIHVEHLEHPGGVRCFFRDRSTADVERSIRSHIRSELGSEVARVEVINEAGVAVDAGALVPDQLALGGDVPAVEVIGA